MKPFSIRRARIATALLACAAATANAQIVAPPTPPVVPVVPPAAVAPAKAPPAPSVDPATPPEPYVPKRPEFNSAPMVRVDVLMVSVPEAKALPLIQQLRDPAQIAAAEQTIFGMIGRKEATLEGWPEVTTHSEIRAVSESIVEQRYPIEFESPVAASSRAPTVKGSNAKPDPAHVDEAVALARSITSVVPTTFETRNTGSTLEVEPIVSPDRTAITLSLAPQLVRFERYAEFPAGTTEKGEKLTVPQPIFTTSKVSITLSLRDGERRLIHIGKATEDRARIDLFILGAKIHAPPAGPK